MHARWLLLMLMLTTVQADEVLVYTLTARDGRFTPSELHVPAGKRFKIVVHNIGPGPEEFESVSLRKELVLAEGVSRTVVFAPLKPGRYRFFGEFHPDTAKGELIVEPQ